MTKHLTSARKSIFDSVEGEPPRFFRQREIEDFSNYPVILRDSFYHRTNKLFQSQAPCILTLYADFLVYSKKKSEKIIEYMDLEITLYRLEIITIENRNYSPKHKFGFVISAHGQGVEFYCKSNEQLQRWMKAMKKSFLLTNFIDMYKVGEVLGTGGYGKVHLVEENETKKKWAGKFVKVSKTKNIKRQQIMLSNEIKILRRMNHETIVKLYEVYEFGDEICMIMDYVEGDKLFNYIVQSKKLSEEETSVIAKQLFLSLHHLQIHDVLHRDIKPENVLIVKGPDDQPIVKLIDFGLATFNRRRDVIKKCGTAGYVAPEILNSRYYDFSADVYSVGIVMMVCLTGKPAFQAKDYDELLEENSRGNARYKGRRWLALSSDAKNLIRGLTDIDPAGRTNLEEALNHDWFGISLPKKEREDLAVYVEKYFKTSIPNEEKISDIPLGTVKPASSNKDGSGSVFESQSIHSMFSQHSFVTGHYKTSVATLHSFYKDYSREDSDFSEKGSNTNTSGSRARSMKNLKTSNKTNGSLKDNKLILPHKRSVFDSHKAAANNKQRRSVSLQPLIAQKIQEDYLERQSSKGGVDYRIQVTNFDPEVESLADVSSASEEDEEETCGGKYLQLGINRYFMKNNNMERTDMGFLSTSFTKREKAVFSMPDPYILSDDYS